MEKKLGIVTCTSGRQYYWVKVEDVLKLIDEIEGYELFEGNKKGIFIRKSKLKEKLKGEQVEDETT